MKHNKNSLGLIDILFESIKKMNNIADETKVNTEIVSKALEELENYHQELMIKIKNATQEKSALICQIDIAKNDLEILNGEKKSMENILNIEHEKVIELQRDRHEIISKIRKSQNELDKINDHIEMSRKM